MRRIDIKLADKLPRWGKFDDLARLGRIGVDRVTVAGDQIALVNLRSRSRFGCSPAFI